MKTLDKAIKFADDFIANNPGFTAGLDEDYIADLLKRTYMAGANGHTYVEMGYAGNYEEPLKDAE